MGKTILERINDGTLIINNDEDAIKAITIHLLTQMEQSMGPSGDCSYRGRTEEVWDEDGYIIEESEPTGYACAIGCIIPDELYHMDLEGLTIDDEVIVDLIKKSHPNWDFNETSEKLLKAFQLIHDRVHRPEFWPMHISALEYLYKRNKLDRYDNNNILDAIRAHVYTEMEGIISQSPQTVEFLNKARLDTLKYYEEKQGEYLGEVDGIKEAGESILA